MKNITMGHVVLAVLFVISLTIASGSPISPNPKNVESTPPVIIPYSAAIDNGVVQIGVRDLGNLGVSGIGIRFLPTGNEAITPGCLCEGWGVADAITGTTGYADEATGTANLNLVSFTSTATNATSIVEVPNAAGLPILRVTHAYHPSLSPNLYQVDVSIENIGSEPTDIRYRRVMDWDIEPTAFSEFVTLQTGTATEISFTSDDGFASANPLAGPSSLLFTGEAVDSGPSDHGALFDFNFSTLAPGETKRFVTFYGAAATESEANDSLAVVGAEAYSFGQPNTVDGPTLGTPNTFIFAFEGIGGAPVFPACSDGIDNDGDGLIDFPADPGCSSSDDEDETDSLPPPSCTVPGIKILPESGPNVAPDGTILAPMGEDAFSSVGLSVQYDCFNAADPYAIFVTDNSGATEYSEAGGLPTGNDVRDVHWTVPSDLGRTYTITGEGWTQDGRRITYVRESAPIEPVPVSGLVLGGFVAAGMLLWRRRT